MPTPDDYMTALFDLELDRPLPQAEEAHRVEQLDALWRQLSDDGQAEAESRLALFPAAPDSLHLVDRDPHGQVPYTQE